MNVYNGRKILSKKICKKITYPGGPIWAVGLGLQPRPPRD